MNIKNKTIFNFVLNNDGIAISPMLESLIENPGKVETLNNVTLEQAVKEFAPIYQKYRYVLDGSEEILKINIFTIHPMCRLTNKPQLEKILTGI